MNTKNFMKNYIFLLCFLPVLVSCASEFDQPIFERERRLWTEQGFQNYSFEQNYRDNSGGDYAIVIIKDGNLRYIRATEGRYEEEGRLYLPDYYKTFPCTDFMMPIPEIFARIEMFGKRPGAGRIRAAEYEEHFHYPKYVWYERPGIYGVDGSGDSWSIRITNFTLDPVVPEETSFTFNRETFDERRQEWAVQNNRNYTFQIGVQYYASGDKKRNSDSWSGRAVVKDGNIHALEQPPYDSTGQPGETVRDWVTSIDRIYAKVAEEAEKYDGEPGVYIDVRYVGWENKVMEIYFLRISPESPAESFSYEVRVHSVNEPRWW